jgi:hypothetical protein
MGAIGSREGDTVDEALDTAILDGNSRDATVRDWRHHDDAIVDGGAFLALGCADPGTRDGKSTEIQGNVPGPDRYCVPGEIRARGAELIGTGLGNGVPAFDERARRRCCQGNLLGISWRDDAKANGCDNQVCRKSAAQCNPAIHVPSLMSNRRNRIGQMVFFKMRLVRRKAKEDQGASITTQN